MPEPDQPDLIWIELHFETNQSQSEVNDYVSVPRAEWEAKTTEERQAFIDEELDTFVSNIATWGGEPVDADQVPAAYLKDGLR